MSKQDFERALATDRPYFGPYMACRRSWPYIYWYQQRLMRLLARKPRITKFDILEIGAWAGASTVSWGIALQTYFGGNGGIVSVDPWKSNDHPDVKSAFLHNVTASGLAHSVEPFEGTSSKAFGALINRRFDLIYIDGDHSYEHVSEDIAGALRLLKPDSVICGDDLEVQLDEVSRDAVIGPTERGETWATNPATGIGFHPGVTRAVAEVFGPVSAWDGFWAIGRENDRWRPFSLADVNAPVPPMLMEYDDEGRRVP